MENPTDASAEKKAKKEKKERRKSIKNNESFASTVSTTSTASDNSKKEKKKKKTLKEEKEEIDDPEIKAEIDQILQQQQNRENDTDSSVTEAPKELESEDETKATDADHLLMKSDDTAEIQEAKQQVELKENKRTKILQRLKSQKHLDPVEKAIDDGTNPWFRERDCLLLLLQARMMLKELVTLKLKEERIRTGQLNVQEIHTLIKSQKEEEETDWIAEIQELKRNILNEIRKNHQNERDLSKLDKRIALLIKNRGNMQELLLSANPKKSKQSDTKHTDSGITETRKLEHYSNLFYLLQTEGRYLANLIYLMEEKQMEAFMDTVIISLYGDAFSPREEYLILRLFQLSIQREFVSMKKMNDFLKQGSVVPKMLTSYNKRKQGTEYLKTVIGPVVKAVMGKNKLSLELKPKNVLSDIEFEKGEKISKPDMSEDDIAEIPEVVAEIKNRVKKLEGFAQDFLDTILSNKAKIPYGIRWVCKQIKQYATEKFADKVSEDDIFKILGYFVYYGFINLAIVTPQNFDLVDKSMSTTTMTNLVAVGRVLQYLFNFSLFEKKSERWMSPMNNWVKKNFTGLREFFTELIDVAEPEDFLQVDKYVVLTQKSKPLIIISLHEISQTHGYLSQNISKLCKDKDDPLRLILSDLGEVPNVSSSDDREIQLTLTNRFKQTVEEEISASASLYVETKELIISTLRQLPPQPDETSLVNLLNFGKKYAKEKGNTTLEGHIDKILANITKLEKEGTITPSDHHANFLKDIALEVANRAEIREQQRKEIKRLNATLRNLQKHQKYLLEQIDSYNKYLQECRLKHYQPQGKKKKSKTSEAATTNKIGPFKFSYSALVKKGVILEADISNFVKKKIEFFISSESVGVFKIVAKVGDVEVETKTLELDDLLERNYNNITRLELDQLTLDVNMTIHLLNKFFLK